jgi:alkylation response protein AidB-like acyl-CoA dehydrogenase
MDFSLTDEQRALAELAAKILGDRATLERLKTIEKSEERFDRELWSDFAAAGLLGAGLPENVGGSGGGFVELCLLLAEQGRRAAMIPLLATIVSAAMPIDRFGSAAQRGQYLPSVVAGETLLTAALVELGSDPRSPATKVTRDATGWRIDGVKTAVPMAHRAAAVLVPARTADDRIGLFLVDPSSAGVKLARQEATSWEAQFRMELSGVRATDDALVGTLDEGASILGWTIDRTIVGLCAIAAGACQESVRITAEYVSNRKQFDKPVATFQAVGQRMADSYIDNEAVGLTMWQAATRLADELPSPREVTIAKFWAADAGSRIGHAALHLHGGISIDVDYPIHRYFLWLKQIENTLGAATPELVRLGKLIADEAP